MRSGFLALLLAAPLCAQTQPVPGAPPKPPAAAAAESTPKAAEPATPPDTVVAKIDGKNYTAAEINALVDQFPPQVRGAFANNPVHTLNFIFMLQHLAHQAEFENLDKDKAFQQDWNYSRLNLLSNAELNHYRNTYSPTHAEEQTYYNDNIGRFQEAHVRVIYISFVATAPAGDTKSLGEPDAKAKIDDLRKRIEAGEDFAKVAADNSEDKASAAKGGEFPIITRVSPYPDAIKNTVFALKPGELSQPVRQPNGFYLFKLDKIETEPFNNVESKIFQQLQQDHFNDWVKSIETRYNINVVDSHYFAGHPPR